MHFKRVVSALIFVPVFYAYTYFLPAAYFLFLLIFLSTIALWEFYSMSGIRGILKYAGILCGIALLASFFEGRELFAAVVVVSVLLLASLRLFIKRDPVSSMREISSSVLGLLYIPGLLAFQIDIIKAGSALLIFLYTSVWVSDSIAYYVGKGFGKKKLYEEVSPNKTMAGAAGSIIGGVLGAWLVKAVLIPQMPLWQAFLAGAVIGLVSIIGDLVESMLKRDAGVKDSSGLIPGHGGVLDKLDSLTFAGPVFYWLCRGLGVIQ